MKRAGVLTGAILLVVMLAGTALAQSYPGTPGETTSVEGTGGGTAFTGGNVGGYLIALGVLVVVGLAAMFVARRRSTNGAG